MTEFVRFPSTPYLLRPDGVEVRDDKVLTSTERAAFLTNVLHVEEKVDGENLGISFDGEELQFQARGSYVRPGGRHFHGLETWVRPRARRLEAALGTDLVLFGEWCAVTHSVYYDRLPDWFLIFDVFDRSAGGFWEVSLRDELADYLGLRVVPFLDAGIFSELELGRRIQESRVGSGPMEGLVARSQDPSSATARAKIVRPDFVQQIDGHWTSMERSMNRLATV